MAQSVVESSAGVAVAAHVPRVSIGLAVYNGARYLEQSIESLLSQTYRDFELIISDNASTDCTPEICRKYAEQDKRIRLYRNATNIGGSRNHNRAFELARGEYFRWAAHDDLCAPNLIEKCVATLDANPSVVLCYPQFIVIDADGRHKPPHSRVRGTQGRAYQRFAAVASSRDGCEQIYGLCRTAAVRKTRLHGQYTNSDRTLLSELTLQGPFHEIPEPLFYKRTHEQNVYTDWRVRMAWFNPRLEGKITFPFWLQFFDYLDVIKHAEIPAEEKALCYAFMLRWLSIFGKNMGKDVLVAAQMLLRSDEWRKRRHARFKNWA